MNSLNAGSGHATPVPDARPPVHVLTGFLGSGKTSLLRHWLAEPAFADTAVLVNEFGEAGLDHLLLRAVRPGVALLGNGCVCCTVQDDLVATLVGLAASVQAGEVPPFARVVLETTGLADAGPVLQALMCDRRVAGQFRIGQVVVTLDALLGPATLARRPEAVRQLALADRILLTKTDLASQTAIAAAAAAARGLNGTAPILRQRPRAAEVFSPAPTDRAFPSIAAPAHGLASLLLTLPHPVAWRRFATWLELLLAARGASILRLKGLLAVQGLAGPLVIQGVQHVIHPPEELPAWPEGLAATRLVLIAEGLDQAATQASFAWVGGGAAGPGGRP